MGVVYDCINSASVLRRVTSSNRLCYTIIHPIGSVNNLFVIIIDVASVVTNDTVAAAVVLSSLRKLSNHRSLLVVSSEPGQQYVKTVVSVTFIGILF